jgi:hypothetical protein
MGVSEGIGELIEDTSQLGVIPPLADPVSETPSVHPTHDEKGASRLPPEIVQRNDVGMLETGDYPRLLGEAADKVRSLRQFGVDYLDGHLATDCWLKRPVDDPDRSTPCHVSELVPADGAPRGDVIGRDHSRGKQLRVVAEYPFLEDTELWRWLQACFRQDTNMAPGRT